MSSSSLIAIAMLVTGDKERLLLELGYTEEGVLENVDWLNIVLIDVSKSDMKRLTGTAETLKIKRLAKAGKIGRNDPYPCGSRKKYKHCRLK